MNIFKKLLVGSQQKELTAYETWSVRWRSRHGQYYGDTQDECELFTTKEDADIFAEELRKAFRLIKHTSGIKVEVNKN